MTVLKKNTRAPAKTDFTALMVARIMQKKVRFAHPQTKADVIASLTIESFGAIPIVDQQQRLVGIVSEHDLWPLSTRDRSGAN